MKTIILFLSILFACKQVYSQQIQNVEYFLENKNILITYDLVNCTNNDLVDISIEFVEQSNQKILPKSLIGDIKNVGCGSKKIVWNINNDNIELNGRYQVVLNYTISPKGVMDGDGNVYKTVVIGKQEWFAENLRISKYNDGTPIPNVIDNTQWSNLTTGAWCYYNNDDKYNAKYGKLYNWYAVSKTTNGNKNVCPVGWHVPKDDEWSVLKDYLGGAIIAGGKMKEVITTSWNSPNTDATNKSGFTGLPGGVRYGSGGYGNIGYSGFWWGSTENDTFNAWNRILDSSSGSAYRNDFNKTGGLSVRCLRD
jgi:uncharacterized protein (TIGR02145 family)